MFNWFRRRGAPKLGPDYRHIDTREKAEKLCARGELQKLLLLPVEFGGEDIAPNVIYVPPFAAELKTRLDLNTILPLAREGQVSTYTATPEYEGKSVVPTLVRVAASDPGHIEGAVSIWGKAVQQAAPAVPPAPVPAPPPFAPAVHAMESLRPEEFVRAFIADYDAWNSYAYQMSEQHRDDAMAAAEDTYMKLIRTFCLPGHVPQPIAFGSESSHDLAHESVTRVEPGAGGTCIVKTLECRSMGTIVLNHDYEYHLKKADGRWFLASLLYVDKEGKYESL
jgi:hypothetical protein